LNGGGVAPDFGARHIIHLTLWPPGAHRNHRFRVIVIGMVFAFLPTALESLFHLGRVGVSGNADQPFERSVGPQAPLRAVLAAEIAQIGSIKNVRSSMSARRSGTAGAVVRFIWLQEERLDSKVGHASPVVRAASDRSWKLWDRVSAGNRHVQDRGLSGVELFELRERSHSQAILQESRAKDTGFSTGGGGGRRRPLRTGLLFTD